jgi:hypothetical protein
MELLFLDVVFGKCCEGGLQIFTATLEKVWGLRISSNDWPGAKLLKSLINLYKFTKI